MWMYGIPLVSMGRLQSAALALYYGLTELGDMHAWKDTWLTVQQPSL
jgi:hypothetical protein